MKTNLLALGSLFCGFWVFFLLFQQEAIYHKTLDRVSDNWTNVDGERSLKSKPYEELTNENYIQWDGVHYKNIKDHWYDVEEAGGDYIYAFFPLFPAIWRISMLPPVGIIFLNFILFAIGTLLLLKALNPVNSKTNYIISLAFPGTVVFLIPYTEATFFFMLSLAFYGFLKNKYWLFFLGMMLTAMTRPAVTILLLAFICTEIYYLFEHRNWRVFGRQIVKNVSPLLIGTFLVAAFQSTFREGYFTKFIDVQKYWGHTLKIPHNIVDWSQESFSMNLPAMLIVALPLLAFFTINFFSRISYPKNPGISSQSHKLCYLQVLSVIYVIGVSLYVLLFQSGSLSGTFRFMMCTPFFYLLLYSAFDRIKHFHITQRLFFWLSFTLIAIFSLGLIPYSSYWNFSDLGFFLLVGMLGLWIVQDFDSWPYRLVLYLIFFINIIWTTYMFNMYISNGWIFT